MKVRPATAADVPAVARLVLAALADEAPWKAFCPPRGSSGYVEYVETALRSCLESLHHVFYVLELSEAESGARSGPLVVSASVWDTSAAAAAAADAHCRSVSPADEVHESAGGKASNSRDAAAAKIPDKLAALGRATLAGWERRFPSHGPCLYLQLLATRPDYQRRGYGRAIVSWGTDLARKKHVPACVQAASRAYVLFSGLGFVDLGLVPLPADEETGEERSLKALILRPSPEPQRRSLMAPLSRFFSNR
ncbi:hypothetical protein CDD83_3347 [Cordyceps sp. RAO-2017]|nr:hypothetical protein CDD83_3347 [Cordyceps sp. RAO-2017]